MNKSGDGDKTVKKVRQWILSQGLIAPGDRILCALSGGADSVAMLLLLEALKGELGFELRAAHVNHMLRGAEAERDAAFCESLCEKRKIPFSLLKGDAARLKSDKGLGLEEAARELRYGLLRTEKNRAGCDKIATAHNSGDNLETVLINIIRGAALKGISGIAPVNGDIIRPVLPLSRRENEITVGYYNESYVVDSSNETDFCKRNRIRHHILPILAELNPAAEEMVLQNGLILRGEEEYLKNVTESVFKTLENGGKLPSKELLTLDNALLLRVLRRAAQKAGAELDGKKTFWLASQLKKGGAVWRLDLGGGVFCEKQYGVLTFKRAPAERTKTGAAGEYCVVLEDGTDAQLPGGYRVRVKRIEKNSPAEDENAGNIYKLFNNIRVDCDNISGDLVIRGARAGDSLRRNAKSGSKRLSRLFIDFKVPREERPLVPVVADERGVLWVYGIGRNADYPVYTPGDEGLMISVAKNGTDL